MFRHTIFLHSQKHDYIISSAHYILHAHYNLLSSMFFDLELPLPQSILQQPLTHNKLPE